MFTLIISQCYFYHRWSNICIDTIAIHPDFKWWSQGLCVLYDVCSIEHVWFKWQSLLDTRRLFSLAILLNFWHCKQSTSISYNWTQPVDSAWCNIAATRISTIATMNITTTVSIRSTSNDIAPMTMVSPITIKMKTVFKDALDDIVLILALCIFNTV